MQAWDEERDFRALVAADPEIAARLDADGARGRVRPRGDRRARGHRLRAPRDRARAQGGARACLTQQSISAAARSASSTRSTTTGCCSSRATASRRSTSCCRPRSPTRAACSRGCRRSGSRRRGTSSPNHLLALRAGRPLDRVPAARDAADRVRRPRLPLRLGLEGLPRDGRGLRAPRCRPGSPSRTRLPEPIFTPATKAQTGHDENIDRAAAVELVGEEHFDEAERISLELYRFVSERAAARGIILADTKLEFGVDDDGRLVLARRGVHAGLVALLAGRRVRARRPAAVVRQAVRARLLRVARLGQDLPRARRSRTTSSPARAAATSRRSSADRDRVRRRTSRGPRSCSDEGDGARPARSRGSSTRRARRSRARCATSASPWTRSRVGRVVDLERRRERCRRGARPGRAHVRAAARQRR